MQRSHLPLNALRAFEAAARHQNFTRAALELHVSQTALSHQINVLEARLGFALFHRLPRGVALTEEGATLFPVLTETLDRISAALDRFDGGRYREVLTISTVGTFATGWLLPRLDEFARLHPAIDLRVQTHNNRIDLASEGLDLAIRFGDGQWPGMAADEIMRAPLAAVSSPALARRLRQPADLAGATLLRSYRADEWAQWSEAAGLPPLSARGPVFDSSLAIAEAAAAGIGVGLLPLRVFERQLAAERIVPLFGIEVETGRYWLCRLRSREESREIRDFREWLQQTAAR